MPDAAYYRRWRAQHPEYQERERERSRRRRASGARGDRSGEYRRRRARERAAREAQERLEAEAREHPILTEARDYVRRWSRRKPDTRTAVYSDVYEEMVAEVVLALCEGRPAYDGLNRATRAERAWYEHNWTGRGLVDIDRLAA